MELPAHIQAQLKNDLGSEAGFLDDDAFASGPPRLQIVQKASEDLLERGVGIGKIFSSALNRELKFPVKMHILHTAMFWVYYEGDEFKWETNDPNDQRLRSLSQDEQRKAGQWRCAVIVIEDGNGVVTDRKPEVLTMRGYNYWPFTKQVYNFAKSIGVPIFNNVFAITGTIKKGEGTRTGYAAEWKHDGFAAESDVDILKAIVQGDVPKLIEQSVSNSEKPESEGKSVEEQMKETDEALPF